MGFGLFGVKDLNFTGVSWRTEAGVDGSRRGRRLKKLGGHWMMASFLLRFLLNRVIFLIIGEIELFGDNIKAIGNDSADTTAVDKDEFSIEGSHEHIIDDGDDLDPFPVTGFEDEKDLFPF